jgi:hypothetical protein
MFLYKPIWCIPVMTKLEIYEHEIALQFYYNYECVTICVHFVGGYLCY